MAKDIGERKKNGSDSAINDPKHNVKNLNKLIRECAGQMVEIKRQRAELNEQAGEIRQRLKDSGVQTAAFDYAVRVSQMEQEARGEYIDSLRINFEALGIGGQGDLFPDMDEKGADEQPAEQPSA